MRELASESLYAEPEPEDEEDAEETERGRGARAVSAWLALDRWCRRGRRLAALGRAQAARARATHFTVSASGDLLMHQPLLDRARANGGGERLRLRAVLQQDRAIGRGRRPRRSATPRRRWARARPPTYPIFNTPTDLAASIHRSGWDACNTASNHSVDQGQAGINGTVKALHKRRRQAHRLVQVRKREQAADDPQRPRGEGRLRRLHRRHQRPARAASVVGQRVRRRRTRRRARRRSSATPARPATPAPTR